ncbi:hypothetical protein HMPREF9088_0309 [Enterococcus italicus DSM 15952]|uniref:Uncharacterized protein n=1 Tax=Enterococcus italicus (strain DSM 15952 / CCUG 50447 / LMG 22039 / TP 1.5) TaxID=888064 RepID=E6LD69_ENTI1|nr:hypothetical protein HMPREF9088_0309 [Enterococcus italicus DSM 15952]
MLRFHYNEKGMRISFQFNLSYFLSKQQNSVTICKEIAIRHTRNFCIIIKEIS